MGCVCSWPAGCMLAHSFAYMSRLIVAWKAGLILLLRSIVLFPFSFWFRVLCPIRQKKDSVAAVPKGAAAYWLLQIHRNVGRLKRSWMKLTCKRPAARAIERLHYLTRSPIGFYLYETCKGFGLNVSTVFATYLDWRGAENVLGQHQ